MGDRGNIEIRQPHTTDSVYLYTHWGGSDIASTLAAALDRGRGRWSDPAYLTRIIFDELTAGDRSETGFGISVGQPDDNEHHIPVVQWTPARDTGTGEPTITYHGRTWTPDEYVAHHRLPENQPA